MPRKEFRKLSNRRALTRLDSQLETNLRNYAIAAGAASVSILAMAHPCEARILYTAAHTSVTNGTVLDLNHDGVNDFTFSVTRTSHTDARFIAATTGVHISSQLSVLPGASANQVWGVTPGFGSAIYASALKNGVLIQSSSKFTAGKKRMLAVSSAAAFNPVCFGPWQTNPCVGVNNRYLGFKFTVNGQIHYGWARLSTKVDAFTRTLIIAVITGYAYETIAGKPILSGKMRGTDEVGSLDTLIPGPPAIAPATLGLLAQGAPALTIWRREEEGVGIPTQ